jgi:hypothetical protein
VNSWELVSGVLVRLNVRSERLQEADSKSKSKTTTVHSDPELNDWLDEYRHLSYPQRIEKQAPVTYGLLAMVAQAAFFVVSLVKDSFFKTRILQPVLQ